MSQRESGCFGCIQIISHQYTHKRKGVDRINISWSKILSTQSSEIVSNQKILRSNCPGSVLGLVGYSTPYPWSSPLLSILIDLFIYFAQLQNIDDKFVSNILKQIERTYKNYKHSSYYISTAECRQRTNHVKYT